MSVSDLANEFSDGSISEGRRVRKARLTRRALLDAGLEAFERQPPGLVSVLDITETADVAKGVFYLHFASKDAFLLALWEDVQESFLLDLRKAIAAVASVPHVRDDDPIEMRVAVMIAQYARTAAHSPKHACFALRMAAMFGEDMGAPGELAERRLRYINSLAHVMSDNEAAVEMWRPVVLAIDAWCWGVIWQARQFGNEPPEPDDLVGMILPGVQPLLGALRS